MKNSQTYLSINTFTKNLCFRVKNILSNKVRLMFLILLLNSFNSFNQILTFDFAGIVGSEVSVNSNFNNANLTASTITRGAGITTSANADRFNATNWNIVSIADAVTNNDYMEFTITPNAGFQFTISSFTFHLQRSGTGHTQIALRSSADAYATNLDAIKAVVDNATTQSFTFTFAQTPACNVAITYRLYGFAEAGTGTGGPGDGAGNDISVFGTVTSCGGNSITAGAITGAPFDVTCSSDDSGTIDFTSSGTFTAGNVYTAQLSNSSGSFASPLDIGTLTSTANSGSIPMTIPFGVVTGSGYLIRIVSSTPVVNSSSSSSFTVTLTGGPCTPKKPFITSIMLDGCNCPGAIEGRSEIVFANSGGISINTSNPANIDLDYTSNGAQELLLFFRDGSAITTALNTAAGCAGTFVDGRNITIPANAKLMFVSNAFCPSTYNTWSNYCGTGPIYVLYGQDGASSTTDGWMTGGNFSNSSASDFDLVVVGTDGVTYRTRYNYSAGNTTFGEGNYVVYNNDYAFQDTEYPTETTYRTPAIAGALNTCTIIVLPLDYKSFEIESKNKAAKLTWSTYSERNNDYFEVEMAELDGVDFVSKGKIQGNGTTSTENNYSFLVEDIKEGYYYFRLKQVDFNGDFSYSQIKSVTIAGNELAILKIKKNTNKIILNFNKNISQGSTISVFEITGKQIYSQEVNETSKEIEINENLKGMLLIKIFHPTKGIQTFRVLLGEM